MKETRGRLTLLKRANRAQIALAVRRHGAISRVQLARSTGLSVTCVCGLVDDLITDGVLVETGTALGPRGGPSVLLQINPDGPPLAGVFLAPEEFCVIIANPLGETLVRQDYPYESSDESPQSVVRRIANGIIHCMASTGKRLDDLRGIGVAVAGMVDPVRGVVVTMANRRGWDDVPLGDWLHEALAVPAYLEHSVRAGALASQWFTEESRDGGALYVMVSNGIGAAVVHNFEIIRGIHSSAGELGHITVVPDGPQCGCGKHGCLERVASDLAFIQSIWPGCAQHEDDMPTVERETRVRDGIAMAQRGEARAITALNSIARYLGLGIANAITLLDPQTVFIGGTLIDAAPEFVIDLIRQEAVRQLPVRVRGVEITPFLDHQAFMLRGSIGLVLWQPYRQLREDTMTARSVSKL